MTTIVCKLCGEAITATRRDVLAGKAKRSWIGRHETKDRVHTACGEAWHAEQVAKGEKWEMRRR